MRLIGLDDSVVQEEVADVIAVAGGCKMNEVQVGGIRPMSNSLYTVWARCPLGAAIKASQNGKLKIGWTIAGIELLKARPMQCYRCWVRGHLQAQCRSGVDRSGRCYRCGEIGHLASGCSNPVSCILCKEVGLDCNHRTGSAGCKGQDRGQLDRIRQGTEGTVQMGTDTCMMETDSGTEEEEEPVRRTVTQEYNA